MPTRCAAFSTSSSRISTAFGVKGNGLAVAQQYAFLRVQAKGTKRVEVLYLPIHRRGKNFARILE